MECGHPLAFVPAAKADSEPPPPHIVDFRGLWVRGAGMLALRVKILALLRTATISGSLAVPFCSGLLSGFWLCYDSVCSNTRRSDEVHAASFVYWAKERSFRFATPAKRDFSDRHHDSLRSSS